MRIAVTTVISLARRRLRCYNAGVRTNLKSGTFLFLLFATAFGVGMPSTAVGKWAAYNECLPGTNTHANTTRFSPYGTKTGAMKDIQTGTNIAVSLTLVDSGSKSGRLSNTPAAGTPAYVTFNGYVDWYNSSSTTNSIQVTGTTSVVYKISGLSPYRKYNFRGTAVRGGAAAYSDRWSLIEITGAQSSTARHTTNVFTSTQLPGQLTTNQAAMPTGINTTGDMVLWQNVVPSSGGTFSVSTCQFTGTFPGKPTAGTNGYALDMIRLDEADPPSVVAVSPPDGTFTNTLTQIVVTFSESVTNVTAANLLINGAPATGLSGSSNVYTFGFPQPSNTEVDVSWSPTQNITDVTSVPDLFDSTSSSWQYFMPDTIPPEVASIFPPQGIRVRCLTRISVTFNEPVTGVTADSLLIAGQPALEASGSGTGPYTFLFMQPATGDVQVSWAPGQDIHDTSSSPNAFAGGVWTNVVDPNITFDMAMPYVIHISVDGLGAYYLRSYLSNAPAMFPNFIRLRDQGASTQEARCDYYNSVTMPNHTCMLTGRPVSQPSGRSNTTYHGITGDGDPGGTHTIHSDGNPNLTYQYSTLDVVHDRGLSTSFYSSKSKFAFFVRSYNATYGAQDLIGPDNGHNKIDAYMLTDAGTNWYGASEAIVTALLAELTNATPNYAFLHFAEPDYAGHDSDWGSVTYSNAAKHVDAQLGRIFDAIDSTPALSNRIAIVLVADHGGIGGSHGVASIYEDYAIPFFAWGPAVISPSLDAYDLFSNRGNPSTNRLTYTASPQPLRNCDSGNLALALMGLPSIPGSSVVSPEPIPAVALSIMRPTNGLTIFWPSGVDGFQLQWVSDLETLPGGWQNVTNTIETNGALSLYQITLPPDVLSRFYRLRRP